jgi:hypothetical protein
MSRVEPYSAQDELSSDEMKLVVAKLHQISREAALDYAIRVGSLIIHHFYSGDTELWRYRGPKTMSFRQLANHPELPMSASALCRCVAIFELCERLNVAATWRRVTASHLRLVIGLDPEEQRRLLATADRERWSVQRLESEVRRQRACTGQRSSRRRKPALRAFERQLEQLILSTVTIEEAGSGVSHASLDERRRVSAALDRSIEALLAARETLRSLASLPELSTARDSRLLA